ncbi:hypothetical protein [Sphingomonas sp.]|uniref:hypothetical protein n=1 Tax=Sphingomonas sp. TaxID=28214 RepID=UPI002EDA9C9B
MSALGFGLFGGSLIAAVAVGPRAFRQPGTFSIIVLLAGVAGWIGMPASIPGFFGFLVGLAVIPAISELTFQSRIREKNEQFRAEQESRQNEQKALEERRASAQADVNAWPSSQPAWTHISKGRLMHVKGQPKCFFMLSESKALLRIVEYSDDPDFDVASEFGLPLQAVISLNTAQPTVTKKRSKQVPITAIETKNKSPVARGLVGGALLGPAGLVLGAASGLNSKVSSSVHYETVSEEYDTLGDPQLIIGTSNADRPVVKIKFDPPNLADEWLFRIQGAQRR